MLIRVILIITLLPFSAIAQYFQQDVKYTIHAALNDVRHQINCDITIFYKNNSSTTLNELYIHLWPNAYADETTPLAEQYFNAGDGRMLTAKESDFGKIDSLRFQVNGEKAEWQILPDHPDVCRINLSKPLAKGDSLILTTPFRVSLPGMNMSRLGHNQQAYYITQWYPKPAVFDKNGWNYFSYIDKGEFYGEFGTFDVFITLPKNYKVAATGLLKDSPEEIEWLHAQDSLTKLIEKFPDTDSFPPSSKEIKTVHFHQANVHDFAWFADKRWNVLSDTMKLSDNRVISVNTFFNNRQVTYWKNVNAILKKAINHYSENIDVYPYDAVTVVDVGYADGAGMEYPMITTIGTPYSKKSFENTIAHEVGHNWFYGILGNNERCHPWMDEGMNKYFDVKYLYKYYPNDSTGIGIRVTNKKVIRSKKWKLPTDKKLLFNYLLAARTNEDQSPDLCSEQYNLKVYSQDIYHKTEVSLNYLRTVLGDTLFSKCIKDYYSAWKFKHPDPMDMKMSFEKSSGKKLDWFFDDLQMSRKKIDYSISGVKVKDDSIFVKIKNRGQIQAPVKMSSLKNDSVYYHVWTEGFEGKKSVALRKSGADKVFIDAEANMPEIFTNNNFSKTKGLFKKCGKTEFIFGTSVEKTGTNRIYYSPVAGWNNYNGLMAGGVFHNYSFLEKRFEYRLMPMYAFGTKDIAGGGDLAYHIYPMGKIYRVTIRSGISRYAFANDLYEAPNDGFIHESKLHFTKVDSRIVLSLREKHENKNILNELTFRYVYINRDLPYGYNYSEQKLATNYFQAEYSHRNTNPLERGHLKITATGNEDYIQAGAEIKKFINYNTAKKGFEARAYAGYMNITGTLPYGMEHRMSLGGKMGTEDYLFDEVFLGRSEETGILSNQFTSDYAGFKSPTSFYRLAQEWMMGVNVSTTLPGMIPFRLFASVGSFNDHPIADITGNISWELGVDLPIIKDIFIISLPFAYSEDIKYGLEKQNLEGVKAIRFEIHLKNLNPLDYIKNSNR